MVRAAAALLILSLLSAGPAVAAGSEQRFAAIDRLVEESMRAHGVQGVSIAIIDDFEVVYARGHGFAGPGRPVETDTLFQAASLTKPVTAVVAAAASEERLIDLDADVAGMLSSWRLPPMSFEGPITLRMLFAHRAGTNVPGFPGYLLDEPLPDLPRILDGIPGKNEPVRVVSEPGAQPSYSGGGYVLAQLAIEDHTGRTLEEMADTLVLEPLGLQLSTYRTLDASDRSRVAEGYRVGGAEVAGGGWRAYPEQAAASLWTTPSEYAAIVIDVMRSYTGDTGVVLDRATARRLLDPDFAVGFGVSREGIMGAIAIGHAGANEGYRCEFAAVPDLGDGVIVMTNSDAGGELASSVIDAVASELAWPRTSWWMPILVVAAAGLAGLVTLLGWLVIRRRRRTRSPQLEARGVKRWAAGLAGTAEPDSDLRRAITIRNVALAVLGAAVLVLNSAYHGPLQEVVHAYAGNVAVSFALYFAAVNATAGLGRPRLIAASLTLVSVEIFEATNGFGLMENVYDPADFVANAAGVGLAVIVDIATGRVLRRRHEQGPRRS